MDVVEEDHEESEGIQNKLLFRELNYSNRLFYLYKIGVEKFRHHLLFLYMKNYLKSFGPAGIIGLTATLLIIIVSEYLFFNGHEQKAIFVGLWAPTLLGFLNYLKLNK